MGRVETRKKQKEVAELKRKALEELRRILEDIAEKQGKDIALNILGQLEHGKPD